MTHRGDIVAGLLSRYGLSISCVIAPVLLSLIVFSVAEEILIPAALHPDSNTRITFSYSPAKPDEVGGEADRAASAKMSSATQAKPDEAGSAANTKTGPVPAANPSPVSKRIVPDVKMFLPALHYAGRVNYAIASGFLFIASLTTLVFATVILFESGRWPLVILSFLSWSAVAIRIAFFVSNPHGRYLVVRDLLNAADGFDGLQAFVFDWREHWNPFGLTNTVPTGLVAEEFVHANTIIALVPVGMLLTALAAMSWPTSKKPQSEATLQQRLMRLRCAIVLGSACFVMGVLCNKALVEWPLQLVSAAQAKALRPIADSLVLQFGALGTAAIFAAFTPAIAAWMLDVQAVNAASPKRKAKAGNAGTDDKLIFAPMATVTAVVAMLAPVLASPVVDSLKSLVGALSK